MAGKNIRRVDNVKIFTIQLIREKSADPEQGDCTVGGGMPFRREAPPAQAKLILLMSLEAKEAAGVLRAVRGEPAVRLPASEPSLQLGLFSWPVDVCFPKARGERQAG